MSNIYDYLKWRGDLSMRIDPFNDIDGLILSELVYVDFDKIAGGISMTLFLQMSDGVKAF